MSEDERVSGPADGNMTCTRATFLLRVREDAAASARTAPTGEDTPLDPSLLSHLAACAKCRAEAFRLDPSLLFALAASAPPQPDWSGFNEAVLAGIGERERATGLLRRLVESGFFAPRRLVPALAVAGGVAVAAIVVWQTGLLEPAPPVPLTTEKAGPAGEPAPGARPYGGSGLVASVLPSPVEGIESPTARVIQLRIGGVAPTGTPATIGAGTADASDFVLILDEGIDL